MLSRSLFFIQGIENWISSKSSSSVKSEILKILGLINSESIYSDVIITDAKGKLLISLNPKLQQIDLLTQKFILKALEEKKILSTDLYRCPLHNEIHLDYIVPITGKNNLVIASLILRVNPDTYLYPLINEWPTQSKTSETMIIRKDGDSVLYLNELTHQKNTALKLRIPLTRKDVPAVKAALGFNGIFEGTSYRGTKVLSYISQIEDTPWIMIAQEDESEIYAALYFREIVIISFTLLLIVTLSVGLIWYYHYRQRNIYRELFVKEKELREYHEEFRTILYSIGDGVITTDMEGNVKQMNPVAEELTGWNETEAKGKRIEEIFKIITEATRSKVENPVHKVLKEGVIVGLANHTLLISKDGKEIPIADSGAPIRDEKGEIEGVVLVFRDKTEEHTAEKLIRQSKARLNRAELASKAGNWELNLSTQTIVASEGAAKIFGVDWKEMNYEVVKKVPLPEYRSLMDTAIKNLIEKNEAYDIEYKIRTVDTGEIKDIHSVAHYDKENKILFGVIQDITERKKAETALVDSEEKMRTIVEGTPYLFFYTQDNNANITYISPSIEKITGYTVDQWLGQKHWFVTDSGINKLAKEKTHAHLRGESVKETIFIEITHANGNTILLEVYENPIIKENKVVGLQGIARDITEQRKLEQERFQLLSILENSLNEIYVFDSSTLKFEYANHGALQNIGYTLEEMKNLTPVDIQPEYNNETFRQAIEPLINAQQEKLVFETIHQRKDGTNYPVEIHLQLHKLENKSVFFAIINDITERKKTENALKEREAFLNNLLTTMPIPVFYKDTNGNYIDANTAFTSLFGYSKEQLIGKSIFDLYPKELAEVYFAKDKELFENPGDIQIYESRFLSANGEHHDVVFHKAVFRNDKGEISGLIGAALDITERKRAEEALRQSEERYRTTLYSIGDGVIATNNRGFINQMNPIAESLTGWSEQEARNKPLEEIFKIVNETTRSSVENPVHKVLKEGKIVGLANHTLLISKDGTEIPIADSGAPIRNENGDIDGVVLVFRDQLKERAAQKILEESEAQLKQSQRVARIGYYIFDITADTWSSSEMLDELFGIDKNYKRNTEGWLNLIHPNHREEMTAYLTNHILQEKKEFNKEYKILRKNDSAVFWVYGLGSLELDKNGNPVKMFGTIQDVTERIEAQNTIKNSLKEKEILLKEIHHRVKNNFQRIISLIALQTELINDQKVLDTFEDLQNRLRTMSLIHELMYGTGDFVGVDVKDYITRLTNYLVKTYSSSGNVKLNLDLESHSLDLETIIPCGLIANEIVTNSLKYAFPNDAEGTVNISFKKKNGDFCLEFFDNGIGIKNKIDFENINSLGLRLIDLLTKQLRGTLEVVQPDNGLQFIIKFKGEN
ncbi:MAG: PAS domain S-box protein [Melioribacteraceae bacterium]